MEGNEKVLADYLYDIVSFRDFDGLEPIAAESFKNGNDFGYAREWVVRIVVHNHYGEGEDFIIEFYDAESGQFVQDYFVNTFLNNDGYDVGYGDGLNLYDSSDVWKITESDADEIREWCENVLNDISEPMRDFKIDNILRDFPELEPLGYMEQFDNGNDRGYVTSWFVRIAYNRRIYNSEGTTDVPIIEFYDLNTGRYARDYFVDEFLGYDNCGTGYGHEIALDYLEPNWALTVQDADEIREWCENALYDSGESFPFLER